MAGYPHFLNKICVRYVSAFAMEVGSRFALPPHTECTQARRRLPRADTLAVKRHAGLGPRHTISASRLAEAFG